MSQENLEIIREVMEAFNRGDREAWLAVHDPGFEFRADPEWPESETVSGPRAVWDFVVSLTDAWEPDDFEMVEAVDAGDERIAARLRRPVRGKASGVADVLDYWCVFTFRDGTVLRTQFFADRAEALESVGLSE